MGLVLSVPLIVAINKCDKPNADVVSSRNLIKKKNCNQNSECCDFIALNGLEPEWLAGKCFLLSADTWSTAAFRRIKPKEV